VRRGEFVWGQIQIVHPLSFPLWLAGDVFLLQHPSATPAPIRSRTCSTSTIRRRWMHRSRPHRPRARPTRGAEARHRELFS